MTCEVPMKYVRRAKSTLNLILSLKNSVSIYLVRTCTDFEDCFVAIWNVVVQKYVFNSSVESEA